MVWLDRVLAWLEKSSFLSFCVSLLNEDDCHKPISASGWPEMVFYLITSLAYIEIPNTILVIYFYCIFVKYELSLILPTCFWCGVQNIKGGKKPGWHGSPAVPAPGMTIWPGHSFATSSFGHPTLPFASLLPNCCTCAPSDNTQTLKH